MRPEPPPRPSARAFLGFHRQGARGDRGKRLSGFTPPLHESLIEDDGSALGVPSPSVEPWPFAAQLADVLLLRDAAVKREAPRIARQAPAEGALIITGSLPLQLSHVSASVTSSHMKCATFAMFVLSGLKILLTSVGCSS